MIFLHIYRETLLNKILVKDYWLDIENNLAQIVLGGPLPKLLKLFWSVVLHQSVSQQFALNNISS